MAGVSIPSGMTATNGGASASDKGDDLRGQAGRARAARKAGAKVVRGQSETALKKQAKAWDAGAVGEERAARQLERLRREGFTVHHDVLLEPPKKWNLDHMIYGPAGVFFADAKNWRGDITIYRGSLWRHWYAGPKSGRQSEDMAREVNKVKAMAQHASNRLGTKVTPVICLAGSKSRQFEGVAEVGGVVVVSVDKIVGWLRDSPATLTADKVRMWAEIGGRVFPPATAPASTPQDAERARWEQAMRAGGAPSVTRPNGVQPGRGRAQPPSAGESGRVDPPPASPAVRQDPTKPPQQPGGMRGWLRRG